jgi:hypothetical protein
MVLQFEVEPVGPEELSIAQSPSPCLLIISRKQGGRDVPGEACAERDKPPMVALEELVVDSRLVIESLGVPEGGEGHEVAVPFPAAREKDEMMVAGPLFPPRFLVPGSGRFVDLRSDDGSNARPPAFFYERERAEHVPVIRQGEARHFLGARLVHERFDGGSPIEEGIVGVTMEMDEWDQSPSRKE